MDASMFKKRLSRCNISTNNMGRSEYINLFPTTKLQKIATYSVQQDNNKTAEDCKPIRYNKIAKTKIYSLQQRVQKAKDFMKKPTIQSRIYRLLDCK